MAEDTIVETIEDTIKIVRFNKAQKKNAIDLQMYIKVTSIIRDAAANDNISMVVLTGTKDYFSSGNDLVSALKSKELLFDAIENFVKEIIKFPKLLVAIVNGPAVGIAVTILPLFDFVYASENAYFYTPFTKLGIVAEGCSTYTFPLLMGPRKSMELLVLNKKMDAKEALACGLVSNVWKPEELNEKSWAQIHDISQLPSHCVTISKKLLRRPLITILLETNKLEWRELRKLHSEQSKL